MKVAVSNRSQNDSFTRRRFGGKDTPVPNKKSVSVFPNSFMFIQRNANCPCGGGCPLCKTESSCQPKLKINEPNDKYEQEADRVAEQVIRTPEAKVQRKPT